MNYSQKRLASTTSKMCLKTHIRRCFFLFILSALLFISAGGNSRSKDVGNKPEQLNNHRLEAVKRKVNPSSVGYQLTRKYSPISAAKAAEEYDNAAAYIVVDYDSGEIVLEKNADKPLLIASLTKIMTAVITLDLLDPETTISVSKTAMNQVPTKIGLITGQHLSVSELLHASLMTSANDATEALKEGIDNLYGKSSCIDAMNIKAKALSLKKTHFSNAEGFDTEGNYSSAEDLALLVHYAMSHYPLIAEIVKKDKIDVPGNDQHTKLSLLNWNGLLDVYPEIEGVKIGNTSGAGKTMIVLSNRNNRKLLAILLGAPDILSRDLWTAALLDKGYNELLHLPPLNIAAADLRKKYSTWY